MLYITLILMICLGGSEVVDGRYSPTWKSLETRPLPKWFDEAKLGIFIHWGVFSVPSFAADSGGVAWFWWYWKGLNQTEQVDFMKRNYPPDFQYADFAPQFTAEFYDPYQWADIFNASGAKYVVLTSKHHEGFTNWPSANSFNWNSMSVGPHRDLVGDLATAIRKSTTMRFGLYHSLFEFFNPLFLADKASSFKTNDFVRSKTMPELYDIVNRYKPEIIWSDGSGGATCAYWNSTNFIAWLYNDSPVKDTVVVNDRWGTDAHCKHGGYFNCDDRYNPGVAQQRKWENAMTIEKDSWGFRRNSKLADFLNIEEILQTFVTTISCGGNMLMNIGPTKEGTIAPIYEERLRQMGEWLGVVGEAVYSSKPWTHQNDSVTKGVWYTANNGFVYAFVFEWPSTGYLYLASPTPLSDASSVSLIGSDAVLSWNLKKMTGIVVDFTSLMPSQIKNKWLWVLRLQGFA